MYYNKRANNLLFVKKLQLHPQLSSLQLSNTKKCCIKTSLLSCLQLPLFVGTGKQREVKEKVKDTHQ